MWQLRCRDEGPLCSLGFTPECHSFPPCFWQLRCLIWIQSSDETLELLVGPAELA